MFIFFGKIDQKKKLASEKKNNFKSFMKFRTNTKGVAYKK